MFLVGQDLQKHKQKIIASLRILGVGKTGLEGLNKMALKKHLHFFLLQLVAQKTSNGPEKRADSYTLPEPLE